MNVIEKRLHEHFASLSQEPLTNGASGVASGTTDGESRSSEMPRDHVPERLDEPFAKVDSVEDNGPGAAAGIQVGDVIRNFGYVSKENSDGLRRVADCVQGNEGVSFSRDEWLCF